jgi:hypothetical protein
MLFQTIAYLLVLLIIVVTAAVIFRAFAFQMEGFDSSMPKGGSVYTNQLALVEKLRDQRSNGRRDFNDMLATRTDLPKEEYCFVNFFTLGCRFTGYLGPLGPSPPGYFDPDRAVLSSLKMGCRTLVLEIDYYEQCTNKLNLPTYYPRLVVQGSNANERLNDSTSDVVCQSDDRSNILDVCTSIARHAFSNSVPNPADPLIVVLYVIRIPPTNLKKYYGQIAKGLRPLRANTVNILAAGGNYSRQAQEASLLMNPISTYSGQTLIFCNADTSIFRTEPANDPIEDLDYMVNLRLTTFNQQMGVTSKITSNSAGQPKAHLDSITSYLTLDPAATTTAQNETNNKWSLCLSPDPREVISKDKVDKVMKTIGIQCIPIQMFSTGENSYDYMFADDDHFKTWSFIPKPPAFRVKIPTTFMPGEAAPQTDTKGGEIPTV